VINKHDIYFWRSRRINSLGLFLAKPQVGSHFVIDIPENISRVSYSLKNSTMINTIVSAEAMNFMHRSHVGLDDPHNGTYVEGDYLVEILYMSTALQNY